MLGNTLRLIRIANNDMSVNYVAGQMKMPSRYIRRIESGQAKLSLSILTSFSDFYQIPISQILIFNDFKERLKVSDEEALEHIKRYCVCGIDEEKGKQKTK